jgi:hypothetical protein
VSAHEEPATQPANADFSTLRDGGRDPETGRWKAGNLAALKHGQRASTLLDVPELAEAHRARVEAIETDLGGAAQLSAVQLPLVSELARLQLITDSLGADVLARGVLTGKGRTRAAVTVYLAVLDRQQRLAQLLGLSRRQRDVPDLASYLAAHNGETGSG